MCGYCELLASVAPWQAVGLYSYTAKQIDLPDELPPYAAKIAAGTAEYEQKIRDAWEALKADPTVERARAFVELLVLISGELWPVVFAEVIGVDVEDLTSEQRNLLQESLDEHHNYIKTSLAPDIVRGVEQGLDLSSLDYRTVFLYAGALWSLGNVATVMFDGLSLRDLGDLFLFAGPNDEATCTGDRGCAQYANNVYTVAQILAENIFPGRLRCLTNCRHIWLPIASPLTEKKELLSGNGVGLKHLPGRHDQQRHAGNRGTWNIDINLSLSAKTVSDILYAARIGSSGIERLPELNDMSGLAEGSIGTVTVPDPRDNDYDVIKDLYLYQTAGMSQDIYGASSWGIRFENRPNALDRQADIETGKWLLSKGVITTDEAERDYGYIAKHLPGRHDQQRHDPRRGGMRRVWRGQAHPKASKVTKLQTGEIGEQVAMHALQEHFNAEYRTVNAGLNNAPIDVIGDHTAVEVKTGLASNSVDAQKWRLTIGQPGKTEAKALKQMTTEEKTAHNRRKMEAIMQRKQDLVAEFSQELGHPVQPKTVGIILNPEGTKADVFMIDGFHEVLRWHTYATDDYYLGTYDVDAVQSALKHLPGRHNQYLHTPHSLRSQLGVGRVRVSARDKVYAESEVYHAAVDAVKQDLLEKFRERHPDREEPAWDSDRLNADAELVVSVSTIDEERFDHYAGKYNIPAELKEDLMALDKKVDSAMLRDEMRYKDQATFKSPHTGNPSNNAGETAGAWWLEDAYDKAQRNPIGSNLTDIAAELQSRHNVTFSVDSDVTEDPERIHREVSQLLYMAESEPAINNVLNSQVRSIRYVTHLGTSEGDANFNASTGELKIAKKTTGFMHNFPVLSTTWVHELGHAADPLYIDTGSVDIRGRMTTFGRGKHVSSYAWTNDNEDWAESWVAAFTDDNGAYAEYAPEKVAYADEVIEAWRQQ